MGVDYLVMPLDEVKGTNRRAWRVPYRLRLRYAVDGETDVNVLEWISGVFIFDTSHRGTFLVVYKGSFLIMNHCQFWSFA